MILSYVQTGLVVLLASSSAYLLVSNNNLQQDLIDNAAFQQSQAEKITIMSRVKKDDDLEIKKLINQLSSQNLLAVQYQNKLAEITKKQIQFNTDLTHLEKTNEQVKTWLDLEHSIDINRLLNSTKADNKNSGTNKNSKVSYTTNISTG